MLTRWNIDELYHSDDELYHHGVLGMRWGHRKQEYRTNSQRRMSTGKKVAIGAGIAGGAALAGVAIAKGKARGVKRLSGSINKPKMLTAPTKLANRVSVKKPGDIRLGMRQTAIEKRWGALRDLNTQGNRFRTLWTPKLSTPVSRVKNPSGGINRLIANNKNIKVSKIAGRQTPSLNGGSGPMSKSKIPGAFHTPFSRNPKSVSIAGRGNHVGPFGVKTNSFVLHPGGKKDYLNTTTEAARNWSKPGGWSKYKF